MKTLQEVINAQPAKSRRKIAARFKELVAEEMTMRDLRKARKITQEQMAKALGVKQEQISRSEQRTDMHLSTLRRTVEAMGGSLELIAKFPDRPPVSITGISANEL